MMWSGGRDTNESGEPVLLLQPVDKYLGNGGNGGDGGKRNPSPSSSHIGGLPRFHDDDPWLSAADYDQLSCARCDGPLHLLLQLHAPLDAVDRTLYVFGCNRVSCHAGSASGDAEGDDADLDRFRACLGRAVGGELRCVRSQRPWEGARSTEDVASPRDAPGDTSKSNKWGLDDGSDWEDDGDNDWGTGDGTSAEDGPDVSMDDLETMLTRCEMSFATKEPKQATTSQTPLISAPTPDAESSTIANPHPQKAHAPPSFRHIDLLMVDEPPASKGDGDSDDEDGSDEGFSNVDSSKVDRLLSRYLETEDDEEILSCLRGGGGASSNDGNRGRDGGGERYERLPPDERAFSAFARRLQRLPGQVARYAYSGVPLWSVPVVPPSDGRQQRPSDKRPQSAKRSHRTYSPPAVPPCACGAHRVFEFQLLPSLLHVLDVDAHASSNVQAEYDDLPDLIAGGGMNWEALAVYSCPASCDKSREEFVMVQRAERAVPPKNTLGSTEHSGRDDMEEDG